MPDTYYVSPDGDDDHGDGSREKPWRTLHYAFATLPPDSTLVVPPGRYPPTSRNDVTIVAQYPATKDIDHA